jgi:hypothetical protein
MRQTICDRCGDRIGDEWAGSVLEIRTGNVVNSDIAGDYCLDCATVVADAVREVIGDE